MPTSPKARAAPGTMPSPKAQPAEAPLSNGMPVASGMPAAVPTDQRNGMAAKLADLYGAPAAAPATNGNGMPAPAMAGVLEAAPDLHVLVQPDQEIPADAPRIASDGGPYTLRGTTAHFAVYYENGLGAQGPVLADAVLATCEADYAALQNWFGGLTPSGLPFSVYVVAGTFGAYHANCLATEMHCAAFDGTNADLVRMLVVAEADEVFMAAQNKGFNCGWSNGEGLSRVLATERYPAQLDGFASAASWLDSARADYVSTNDQTDRNYVSIGCSTLFLNYLRYQLGYSWNQIIASAGSTLAQTYTNLTGATDAFARFSALLDQHFPAGHPSGLTNDNPFPLSDVSRLEVFARGQNEGLWHMWQTAPNNGWSGWASMGGWITRPVVARNADGRLEVFVIGSDHALWHMWQTAPNNGWSGWASLGGWIDQLTVAQNADGRLEVFARGQNEGLWHMWQTAPNNGWSGWASMGGWIDTPVVGRNEDGRLEVFVIGSDNALWHMWQTAKNNGWSGWASLGGWIDRLTVGKNADGRLEVFARGQNEALWHIWQTAPNNGWSGWASLGGWIESPVLTNNKDGRLEVFVIGSDHALWHIWQTAPSNGWSTWGSLGGWVQSPVVSQNEDGRLEVFVIGSDSALWHIWQTAPNNGWSGWASLGGWIDQLAVGQNAPA